MRRRVAVVILSRNLPEAVDRLVRGLRRYDLDDTDIYVIEAGTDRDKLSEHHTTWANWPEAMQEGLRPARGFNLGIRELINGGRLHAYDYLFLMRATVHFDGPVVSRLLDQLEEHPRVGIISPCGDTWPERELIGPELAARDVVIIGAGETSELTAQALAHEGVRTIFVANRRADRARSIAERFGGSVSSLHDLPDRLVEADIVVASTSSPHPIIGVDELALVMRERDGAPLLLIDIAVPRDIEAACGELEGVTLYDIDDLQAVVARNRQVREDERAQAEAVVEDEIQRFARWMGQLDVMPTISALREHGDTIVEQVLAENAGRWESASPRDRARIDALARSLMARLLHEPTIRLKSVDRDGGHGRVQFARELFGLTEGVTDAQDIAESAGEQADVHPLRRRGAGQ